MLKRIKVKVSSLINWCLKDVNSVHEATAKDVCSSVNELTEPSVSQFAGRKAYIASLVGITSDMYND